MAADRHRRIVLLAQRFYAEGMGDWPACFQHARTAVEHLDTLEAEEDRVTFIQDVRRDLARLPVAEKRELE